MNHIVHTPNFNIELIILAFIIAFFSSYIALLFSYGQFGKSKRSGILISSFAMGLGIWAMHFVAMLGYETEMPITYDVWLILISLVLPITTSFFSFIIIWKIRYHKFCYLLAGIINGTGIACMHFIGMEAMKMHDAMIYNRSLVILSIVVAIVFSWVSYQVASWSFQKSKGWLLYIAALFMGNAIMGMHFTAMKALKIIHNPKIDPKLMSEDAIVHPTALAAIIGFATIGILFLSLVRTFSERNQAIMNQLATEEQNKKDNELYRAILASMLEGVIVFDMNGNVITANYAASKTFGVEHSYLLKTKLSDNLKFLKEDGSILPFEEYQVKRALNEKRPINGEVVGFDQGLGYIQWLLVNVEPLYSPNGGDMTGVVCTFTDITEQEKAGQKLHEYNSLLTTMIENLNFGVVVTDKDDKLIVRNQVFKNIFKLKDDQYNIVGMTIEDAISEAQHLFPDAEAFAARINEIIDKQVPAIDELKFTDNRIIERHYVPFYFEDKYIGNLWILKDITEQKNLENQLISSTEEAIKANRAKSEFLSKMSHELRTPLNGIFGFAQLLELDESLTDEQIENVQEILKAGRYLLSLINDVLDLARVEAGSLQIVSNHVDLEKILTESISMVMPMAQDKNIKVIQEIEKINNIFIDGDPVRLKQIFINLLDNAIKYNLNGGKVSVGLDTSGECAAVCIKDTGYGIHEADYENIFMPFFRSNLTSQQISGTGIGLPLAKQLVESMGGTIAVESQIGMGSSFTVLFPLIMKNGQESQNKITFNDVTSYGDKDYHLLYIEDNESNRAIMKKYFDAIPNVNVSCVDFGYAGIQLAKQYHFDLILLDLNLPDIHGFEVFKKLSQDNSTKDIPVIAVSANAIQQDITEALALGFAEYITKPFDFSKLHHVTSEILGSK